MASLVPPLLIICCRCLASARRTESSDGWVIAGSSVSSYLGNDELKPPCIAVDSDLSFIALMLRSHRAPYILPHFQRHHSHHVCPPKLPTLLHLKSHSWSWPGYRARMGLCCHGAWWRWTGAVPLWTVTTCMPTTRTPVPPCPHSGRRSGRWRLYRCPWHALWHSSCLAANTTLQSGLRISMDALDPSVTPSPQMWSLPRAVKLEILDPLNLSCYQELPQFWEELIPCM